MFEYLSYFLEKKKEIYYFLQRSEFYDDGWSYSIMNGIVLRQYQYYYNSVLGIFLCIEGKYCFFIFIWIDILIDKYIIQGEIGR